MVKKAPVKTKAKSKAKEMDMKDMKNCPMCKEHMKEMKKKGK